MDTVNHIQLSCSINDYRDTLRAILYSIFFHRLMDVVEPETYEVLETNVACSPSKAVQKEVSTKLDEFEKEYIDTGSKRGELAVVFLQKKPHRGWFAISEELIPWEEHLITIDLVKRSSSTIAISSPGNVLQGILLKLINWCAERSGNIPPLPGAENNTLSHQILISPPPPSEIFLPAPSPPLPTRSPPPHPTHPITTTTNAIAHVNHNLPSLGTTVEAASLPGEALQGQGQGQGQSYGVYGGTYPGSGTGTGTGMATVGGYLESVKDGVRAVARAGGVSGWGGRGGSRGGN